MSIKSMSDFIPYIEKDIKSVLKQHLKEDFDEIVFENYIYPFETLSDADGEDLAISVEDAIDEMVTSSINTDPDDWGDNEFNLHDKKTKECYAHFSAVYKNTARQIYTDYKKYVKELRKNFKAFKKQAVSGFMAEAANG